MDDVVHGIFTSETNQFGARKSQIPTTLSPPLKNTLSSVQH